LKTFQKLQCPSPEANTYLSLNTHTYTPHMHTHMYMHTVHIYMYTTMYMYTQNAHDVYTCMHTCEDKHSCIMQNTRGQCTKSAAHMHALQSVHAHTT
jgi:hypothetical protein